MSIPPAIHSPESSNPFELPELPDDKSIHTILDAPIELGHLPLVGNNFSQTPGDPTEVSTFGSDYFSAAAHQMRARLYENALEADILDQAECLDFIENKIILPQHNKRCQESHASMTALRDQLAGVQELDTKTADLIWLHRSGQARPREEGEILMTFPVMRSTEAAKRTRPFSQKAIDELDQYMLRQFLAMYQHMIEKVPDIALRSYKGEETDYKHNALFSEDGKYVAIISRQTVGDVTATGFPTLYLKREISLVGLPVDLELKGIPQNIQTMRDDMRYNIQPVDASYYWTVL